VDTQDRQLTDDDRDVDAGGERVFLRWHAANLCVGAPGLDAVAHPGSDQHPAGDGQRVPARGSRCWGRGRPSEATAKLAITGEVSTDPTGAPSASACEPYRELIAEVLGLGRNAMATWQDLVDDHGFAARYACVRRFVLTLRAAAPAPAEIAGFGLSI